MFYTLQDLIESQKMGWHRLAEIGRPVYREYSGFSEWASLGYSEVEDVFYQILGRMVNQYEDGLEVTLMYQFVACCLKSGFQDWTRHPLFAQVPDSLEIQNYLESRTLTDQRAVLRKILRVFTEQSTIGDVLYRLATRKNQQAIFTWVREYVDNLWEDEEHPMWSPEGVLQANVEQRWQEAISWLLVAVDDPKRIEEAIWRCVWIAMAPKLQALLEAQECLHRDIPLHVEQIDTLCELMSHGHPTMTTVIEPGSDAISYRVILHMNQPGVGDVITRPPSIEDIAELILVQPAFDIAVQLQRKCAQFRFNRRCRAPSCGRLFWTARANATSCPGGDGGRKNKCALEWIRYKRYLTKLGHDPDAKWQSSQFQQQFISYNKT